MILTDEAAFVLLAILAVCVLILVAIAGAGLFLAARGRWVMGGVMIAAVAAFVFGPNLIDRARNATVTEAFEARTDIPDTLDLTGQRVLFIETSSTICGAFCRDVVGLGTDVEAYWTRAGGFVPDVLSDNAIGDVMDDPEYVLRVELAPAEPDAVGQRFTRTATGGGHNPPYDTVIVVDDSSLLSILAPDLIGGPLPEIIHAQRSILVFTDWPDPFSAPPPPPPPTYRSVEGYVRVRSFPFFLFSRETHYIPPLPEVSDAWSRAICPFAGPPEDRDPFTYGYLCDRDSLDALFN